MRHRPRAEAQRVGLWADEVLPPGAAPTKLGRRLHADHAAEPIDIVGKQTWRLAMHWIDPDCLPETKGNVERFLVNHHGEIDGVVLGDAAGVTLIHIPPHLSAEIEAAIQI